MSDVRTETTEPLPAWKQALIRARDICGGWRAMTRAGEVDRNYFYRVMNEYRAPTAKLAIAVSRATNGLVRIEEIAPEIAAMLRAEKQRLKESRARRKAA